LTGRYAERVSYRPRRRKRRRRVVRVLVRVAGLLMFVAASMAAGMLLFWLVKSPTIRQATSTAVTGGLSPARAFPGHAHVNLLLMGKDEDRDRTGRVVHTRGRTDCILLAHVDFAAKQLNILSIPRDTIVRIPGYRGRHKINAANAYGGPELAMQTVERITGVDPDGYLLVDYKLFEQLIDRAGGVTVMVDKQLDYDDSWGNLHIHLKPGLQTLDGREALGLVRFRHSNDGPADSDQERIARQQRLLASLGQQFKRPDKVLRLPGMLSMAVEESQTSLSVGQALCVANFARQLGRQKIRMEVLPSHPSRSALRIDTDRARELVDRLFLQQTVPGARAAS